MLGIVKIPIKGVSGLVIDDDDRCRALIVHLLTAMNFEHVWSAQDGAEGLRLAVQHQPTIVTTDLAMAPIDGLMFLAGLRASGDDKIAKIPVFIFTAHHDLTAAKRAKALGANGFFLKESSAAELSEKIADAAIKREAALSRSRLG